jgi:anti-anti-sigma regulatory factor
VRGRPKHPPFDADHSIGSRKVGPNPLSASNLPWGAAVAAIHLRTLTDARAFARENTITRGDDRGTWLVALRGEHDLATIPLLDEQTGHVWPQCTVAVVDLSAVTFIDSSLIHWLLRVEQTLEAAHGLTLSIVTGAPGGVTGKLFERLRLSHVFACYVTRREAFMQAVAGADAVWQSRGAELD